MATNSEIEEKFWKALKSDMTLMLGLSGVEEGHAQPMTAQLDGDNRSSIWFFTAKDTDLVEAIGARHEAVAHFADKGHDLFATLQGDLVLDNDPAVSTGSGTASSPPGTRAARTTPSYSSSASIRTAPRSG